MQFISSVKSVSSINVPLFSANAIASLLKNDEVTKSFIFNNHDKWWNIFVC